MRVTVAAGTKNSLAQPRVLMPFPVFENLKITLKKLVTSGDSGGRAHVLRAWYIADCLPNHHLEHKNSKLGTFFVLKASSFFDALTPLFT